MKATHIAVIQSGWVFVGTIGASFEKGKLILTDAACVRKWGTTRGLGELALSGPQKHTILDLCGTVEAPLSSVLFVLPVDAAKWAA